MPEFPALAHVAVTVTDLERSTRWYAQLFGTDPVLDEDESSGTFHHTVFALGDGHLFGLHTHAAGPGAAFDERNTGLDHVAFACQNREQLEIWASKLTDMGIPHEGVKDAHYGSGVSFRDPDGIALEFLAPPS